MKSDALRESEQRLRVAARAANLGVFEWDLRADRATWDNARMYAIFGISPEDGAVSRRQFEASCLHPDDRDGFARALDAVAQHHGEFHFVCRIYRRSDGEQRWVEFVADVHDERLVGVVADITERKLAAETVHRSEERFRQLADALPQLVWMANREGLATYYNSQASRYAGIRAIADGLWSWHPVVHPDDLQTTLTAWAQAVAQGSVYECQHRVCMADGNYRWHLSRAHCVEGLQWFGTATDIHDLKETQERLRESEQRFKSMADTAPATLWITDPTHQCTFLSRGWYELTGQTLEQGLGLGWAQALHPDDRARAKQDFLGAAARHESFSFYYRVRQADGEHRWMLDTARPRFDDDGEFLGYIGSVIDVHERKHAEQELQRLNAELSEANRRKDEFLAMLGHELRNPLAAIHTATQLLKLIAPEDARLLRTQGVLERQSAHMTRLVDGLLEVSRIAQGKIRLDRETLDLCEILVVLVQDRAAQIEARDLELHGDFPTNPLWVFADRVRLAQIFDNLLGNAIKFTGKPGRIDVILHRLDDVASLRICDTGIGIEPEMLERVFEPFQQAAQEIHRGDGGLGLGLALARGLIELHGGTVQARSAGRGAGAEFEVRLPLVAPPLVRPRAKPSAALTSRRILIVEDNVDAGQTLHALLQTLGHRVSVVETGAAALEFLRTQSTDVVLCDLGLPGMSGYDVARAVREDASLRHTLLIALTGYGQPDDRRRSAEAGFDDHLTKPVDMAELDVVLDRLTNR